ncbi:type VI secretion system-associated protein [Bordetella genomosp. 9]|uniref:Type VI secretion system-associated protein n=1 Tax=Bordetella genomosp. 9 TaxID=1416803 RepID=A0A261R561_9BORD|nr:type VI secretion system baseplate subunit TssK [Bordetella genomosp. 9]OZI20159.1 type VI secretion system-associated protein [Bordetella genomosp. 9]
MYWNNKIVWSEGMLLQQQHLQQHDRYWRNYIDGRLGRGPRRWGFSRLELDEHQLALGKLALLACEGIMPDGTPFSLPVDDDLPGARDVPDGTRDVLAVLALPLARPGAPEAAADDVADDVVGNPGAAPARYRIAEYTVHDSNADADQDALLQVGRLRLRLAFDHEVAEGHAVLGVVRILERRSDGTVLLDRAYCPPVIDCRAAPRLVRLTDELVGLLGQRGAALADRLVRPTTHGAAEIAEFLLLQLVNRAEPFFSHLAAAGGLHPEHLYREMLRLAGELACFSQGDRRPPKLPPYRHDGLDSCFQPLMEYLRRALSAVIEPQAIPIPLEEGQFGMRVGRIPDVGLLRTASFVLAAGADLPADALWASLPAKLKVGPVEKIHDLVTLQLPGIALRTLPVAPRQLPFHANRCYFALDASDELWADLPVSAGIALHVAGDFPGLRLELWAIRQ